MAKQVKLTAQTRHEIGRNAVKKLKARGIVPATIYGGKEAPQNLQVSAREVSTLLSRAVGENILIELEIDAKANRLALIQEVQHNAITRAILHVDFQTVSSDETIYASIPVEPFGESIGVKSYGGLLTQNVRSLEIECLPKDLPEIIKVDVSALNIGDAIHIKDIALPSGVTAVGEPDIAVFLVAEPTVVEEPVAAAAPTEPEVIKEKKEAPEGEAKK